MIPETCSVVEDESLTEQNLQVFISPRIKLIEMKSGILHWTSPKPFGFQWNEFPTRFETLSILSKGANEKKFQLHWH